MWSKWHDLLKSLFKIASVHTAWHFILDEERIYIAVFYLENQMGGVTILCAYTQFQQDGMALATDRWSLCRCQVEETED